MIRCVPVQFFIFIFFCSFTSCLIAFRIVSCLVCSFFCICALQFTRYRHYLDQLYVYAMSDRCVLHIDRYLNTEMLLCEPIVLLQSMAYVRLTLLVAYGWLIRRYAYKNRNKNRKSSRVHCTMSRHQKQIVPLMAAMVTATTFTGACNFRCCKCVECRQIGKSNFKLFKYSNHDYA